MDDSKNLSIFGRAGKWWEELDTWKRRTISGTAAAIGLVALMRSCTIVPAGNVAVLSSFGSVSERELEPGLKWPIKPWASRIKMDTRTNEVKEKMSVPTKEGLMATLDISILYKIDPSRANQIYSTVGTNYEDVVLVPTLRNVTRDVIANYQSEDLYSSNRSRISADITTQLGNAYGQRGIILENVLMRDVSLPAEVTTAIEKKIGAKQASEQMQYVLSKERQESERKAVEAGGIAEAQRIISKNLTPEYLQWRYITTMESLAHSPNTTFFITPYDQKLTPLISIDGKK